jgi:hypothetical protein
MGDAVQKREIQDAWETYYRIISSIREETTRTEEFPDLSNVKLCASNNHYVLYSQLETADAAVAGVYFC